MTDFLERIRTAWMTTKLYKRRVSIFLISNDRNYTLERICNCNDAILKEPAIYHFSVAGKKILKKNDQTLAHIPAHITEEKLDINTSILRRLCDNTQESGIYIVDDLIKFIDNKNVHNIESLSSIGHQRQSFFDLFEKTLDSKCIGQVFVFLEHSDKRELIPDIVDAEIQIVEHLYPSHDEVRDIVRKEVTTYKLKANKTITDENKFIEKISQQLSGFAYSTISWVIRDAFIKHGSIEEKVLLQEKIELIINDVKQRKEILIGQQLGMKALKSTIDKPIGVEEFLTYIEHRKNIICSNGQDRLKGVLFIGPPGTGKSMLAKYLSAYLGVSAIEVRLSSIMSMWMGETERLFQRLTDVLDAMAPVIIYIDEIEKMFSDEGSGSSAGASMIRATGHLLTWMNDTNFPVFIIATANNTTKMGEIGMTMTRRGRFDALFYVGYPDAKGREGMFHCYLKANSLSDDQMKTIIDMTRFFTGADIFGVIQDAKAETNSRNFYDALIKSINRHRPRVDSMKEMYMRNTQGEMRKLAYPAGNFESEI